MTSTEKPLTQNIHLGEAPPDLPTYERAGGYTAVRQALQMDPAAITALVKEANLKGRGGAGFDRA